MRLLFAGTPDAALPSLRALLDSPHEVVAVLTRADAPSGRGRRLTPSPVKALALDAGIEVLTPSTLRDPQVQQRLRELAPEAAAVVAYGALIPPAVLSIPDHGWVNLHFSLLPAWRGAAPAQRAVLAGETSTGMTVFRLDEGLDTGEIILTRPTPIGEHQTAGELLGSMALEGASLLVEAIDALADGTAVLTPQDHDAATHAPKLTPEQARIDWTAPAEQVSAHIRGMSPDPGAWTTWQGARMKVLGIGPLPDGDIPQPAPGALHATKKHLLVGTGTGPLALTQLAPAGKRPMRAADWARGAGLETGSAFESTSPQQDEENQS